METRSGLRSRLILRIVLFGLAALAFVVSEGCVIATVTPRDSLTPAKAKEYILKYETSRLKAKDTVELKVTDKSFTHVAYRKGGIPQLQEIEYAELGQFRLYYSGWNFITPLWLFFYGPTMTGYEDDNGLIAIKDFYGFYHDASHGQLYQVYSIKIFYSIVPLWIIGTNFWRGRNGLDDLYIESLEYMRRRAEKE